MRNIKKFWFSVYYFAFYLGNKWGDDILWDVVFM